MKNFRSPLYYCTECKTVVPTLDKLLFIEENTNKGFCSLNCIEDFYRPLLNHFDHLEKKTRTKLGLSQEKIEQTFSDKELIEEVLQAPNEVHKVENELGESIVTYIRHFSDHSAIVVCTVYNNEASFIFFKTLTRSVALLQEFRSEQKKEEATIKDPENFSEEDFEFMQLLENKKSKLLADLLVKRKDSDISFEDFVDYENCFQETLDSPDEVFESKDNEGDVFFVYIKSFMRQTEDFFYIVSCLKRKDQTTQEEVSVFPVLAFPTNDMDLYREFRIGQRLSAPMKN